MWAACSSWDHPVNLRNLPPGFFSHPSPLNDIPLNTVTRKPVLARQYALYRSSAWSPYTKLYRVLSLLDRGLLDRSTARYFYKRLKVSLHKPTGNLLENLYSKKCVFKNNLKHLEKKFLSQTNTTPKNGILLNKMAHLLKSSIFQ
jgi:hypothetical protein